MFEPPWDAAVSTPFDIVHTGRKSNGFTDAKYVDMGLVTDDVTRAWAESVRLTEGPSGILVSAKNALGRQLLAAFEIPEGSRILAVNNVLTKANPTTGEPGGTVWEAVLEVERVVHTGGIVLVILDGADGRRHHRYIIASRSA